MNKRSDLLALIFYFIHFLVVYLVNYNSSLACYPQRCLQHSYFPILNAIQTKRVGKHQKLLHKHGYLIYILSCYAKCKSQGPALSFGVYGKSHLQQSTGLQTIIFPTLRRMELADYWPAWNGGRQIGNDGHFLPEQCVEKRSLSTAYGAELESNVAGNSHLRDYSLVFTKGNVYSQGSS